MKWQHQTITRLYNGVMKSRIRIAPLGVALFVLLAPRPSVAQSDDWEFDVTIYALLVGLSGDVVVAGVPKENVDIDFGDVWRNLQMGGMGRVGVHHKRIGAVVDVAYLGIGAADNIDLGFDQWMVQPSLVFHANEMFDLYGGVRYNRVSGEVRGPGGRTVSGPQQWWDPVVGTKIHLPVKNWLGVQVRTDIGGFGAGSKIAFQMEPLANIRVKKWLFLQAGYRWLYMDRQTGEGRERFEWKVWEQGFQFGFMFHF